MYLCKLRIPYTLCEKQKEDQIYSLFCSPSDTWHTEFLSFMLDVFFTLIPKHYHLTKNPPFRESNIFLIKQFLINVGLVIGEHYSGEWTSTSWPWVGEFWVHWLYVWCKLSCYGWVRTVRNIYGQVSNTVHGIWQLGWKLAKW